MPAHSTAEMEIWIALVAKIALVKVDVLVEAKSTLQLDPPHRLRRRSGYRTRSSPPCCTLAS